MSDSSTPSAVDTRKVGWLAAVGPGMLVAATGVGAGDLATSALAGGRLGVGIIWAVAFGAMLKFALNEGLARWQLGTGATLVETWASRRWVATLVLAYLVAWGLLTGGALMSAAGVAAHAMVPVIEDPVAAKRFWGIAQSLLAVGLLYLGGFRLFERAMTFCIGLMFVAVVVCAIRLAPHVDPAALRVVNPLTLRGTELRWTVGLIGGVGGTVTLLSYGYWIREAKRESAALLGLCRVDLAVGYTMTALFGAGMIVIAAATPGLVGSGASFLVTLSDRIGDELGAGTQILFVVGAWAAIFSSMLGVWQGVPYIFADLAKGVVIAGRRSRFDSPTRRPAYRFFLLWLAVPPMILLWKPVAWTVLAYAILGAAFMPVLAVSLLWLNRRGGSTPAGLQNSRAAAVFLVFTLAFFLCCGAIEVAQRIWPAN